MTATLVAALKIIAAIASIYGICKLETYLENKLDETSGKRTDALIISSVLAVVGLTIFIICQAWSICGPILVSFFGKIPV